MDRFTPTVGCLCGGMLVGEWILPGGGWVLGGLLGTWVGWPKEGNGSDKPDQIQESD
jgi:hypothetical protein